MSTDECLKTHLIILHSQHPKIGKLYCLVPGCGRSWDLIGSSQGFTRSAASHHAISHWRKYHEEHKHPEIKVNGTTLLRCPICIRLSDEEYAKH